MKQTGQSRRKLTRITLLDPVVDRFWDSLVSFSEEEALKESYWAMGEDIRLREDIGFRQTPWGRWTLSGGLLANDMLFSQMVSDGKDELNIDRVLSELSEVVKRPCVVCSGDKRFKISGNTLRLRSRFLSKRPLIEEATELQKYVTHLPVHSLKAAAASEPAGEWGPHAQEESIETLGWIRVDIMGKRKLNDRMFVARIQGHSMDNGRSGLVSGGYAVFELWPGGTKQDSSVLVRGAFTDPETGSYAVKKYVGDVRDQDGRHHVIKLVSLNPDKERYPDIVLEPEDDEVLTVVARVVQALSPGQFARAPRLPRRKKRRALADPSKRAKRVERLAKLAERFFNLDKADDAEKQGEVEAHEWEARFICLDTATGGLHIETSALVGMPAFAKKLQLVTGDYSLMVLASNLRARAWRTPVPPSTLSYRWSALGHELMLEDELASITLPGLSSDRPSVFRVDSDGIGREINGRTLSAGGFYRILVPPLIKDIVFPESELSRLDGGWRLWEMALSVNPLADTRDAMTSLGLALGRTTPEVGWVVVLPQSYGVSAGGSGYPVFAPDQCPILAVNGVKANRVGDLEVLLVNADTGGSTSLPLESGSSWKVQFEDLPVGRYVAQVIHERTRYQPVALPFRISDESVHFPDGRLRVSVDGNQVPGSSDGNFVIDVDLAQMASGTQQVELTVPSMWPLAQRWDDGKLRYLRKTYASVDGQVDLIEVTRALDDLFYQSSIANFVLDAHELGYVELCHTSRPEFEDVRKSLLILIDDRLETAKGLAGQFELLQNLWLHPLLGLFGYLWEDAQAADLAGAPDSVTGIWLLETIRKENRIRKETYRALVLVGSELDLNSTDMFSARYFADAFCQRRDHVREAIITDGLRWAVHRRGSHLPLHISDIGEVARAQDLFAVQDFLREFAVVL